MTEDEMVGWHHQLNGHEFEQAPGVGDEEGILVCYSPWGHNESDMKSNLFLLYYGCVCVRVCEGMFVHVHTNTCMGNIILWTYLLGHYIWILLDLDICKCT